MLSILLATNRPEALRPFTEALRQDPEVNIQVKSTGSETVGSVRERFPHLVIVDSTLPDIQPLSLVRELLFVNAMVNTVVVSSLGEEEFHEASEGLGVLGSLPSNPGRSDAAELLKKLRGVLG